MQNESASGISVTIVAIPTFPAGFNITQFADDVDPVSIENVDIADTGMAVNGDMVVWGTPHEIPMNIAVLPGTEEAKNLDILYHANRVAKNKVAIRDVITATINYPDGERKVLTNGAIISGPPLTSASSSARLNTREYGFRFENMLN